MYGIRLLGISLGFSPIKPLLFAPIGLKYLNTPILYSLSAIKISFKKFSNTILELA